MTIKTITIENVKGIAAKTFDLDILPIPYQANGR